MFNLPSVHCVNQSKKKTEHTGAVPTFAQQGCKATTSLELNSQKAFMKESSNKKASDGCRDGEVKLSLVG